MANSELIFGQGTAPHGRLPIGWFGANVGRNGCGAVAVHNALLLTGRESPGLPAIIRDFWRTGGWRLFGFMGAWPWAVARQLRRLGYAVEQLSHRQLQENAPLAAGQVGIVYFQYRHKRLRYGHFVTFRVEAPGRAVYYNVYNTCRSPRVFSDRPMDFLEKQQAVKAKLFLIRQSFSP